MEGFMRTRYFLLALVAIFIAGNAVIAQMTAKEEPWSFKASYIEACSCELFCTCYFGGPDKDFCKFNNAIKVTSGHHGKVKIDGVKFWISGDLGGDFKQGFKTAVLTFDPSATKEQVDAVVAIIPKIYTSKWASVIVDPVRKPIVWEKKGNNGYAKLGDGDGEVMLTGVVGNDGKNLVTIKNLSYFLAKKNNGFVLAKSKHHYKGNDLDYAFEDANGFFIEIESSGGGM